MGNSVRVYLNENLMTMPEFKAKHWSANGGRPYVEYFFMDLPIGLDHGRFYMDTTDGIVPEVFKKLLTGDYSMVGINLDGQRPPGEYRDELKFPGAEASARNSKNTVSPIYQLEVSGKTPESVIGLYKAIVNNELLPISAKKTAPELVTELEQKLAGCEAMIAQQESEFKRVSGILQNRNERVEELEEQRARRGQRISELEISEERLTGQLNIITDHCIWFSNRFRKLYYAWYRLPFLIVAEVMSPYPISDAAECNRRVEEVTRTCKKEVKE